MLYMYRVVVFVDVLPHAACIVSRMCDRVRVLVCSRSFVCEVNVCCDPLTPVCSSNTIHTSTACLLSHETCDVTTLTAAAAAIEVDVMVRAHLRPITCSQVSADVVM